MAYTVNDLKSELSGMLHGTSLNQVENINGVIYRAARRLLADVDPQETVRYVQLQPFNQYTYNYTCPADLKDDRIIDIRKQTNRLALDNFHQEYSVEFDVEKTTNVLKNNFSIDWKNGNKTILVDIKSMPTVTVIDGVTDSSIYTATTGASNTYTDNSDFTYGQSSIAVQQNAAVTTISTTFADAIDISAQTQEGTIYGNVWFEDALHVTSVSISVGTDSSNKLTMTQTMTQDGITFQNGWNSIGALLSSGVTTGSYTGLITYLELTVTTTSNQKVKWNYVRAGIGEVFGCQYYSKYLFRNATTGAFQETITSLNGSEIINLDTTSYNLLLLQTAAQAAQQSIPLSPNSDVDRYEQAYQAELARYIAKIKSQTLPASATWYRVPPIQNYPFSWFRLR